ncbi:MAG: class I mannose-6-phosphate isomerase [Deltaproteobacteria bacterium]|nr:class I mannose-6-phosphate isomerase [Deltaproteobacteria bacterium]
MGTLRSALRFAPIIKTLPWGGRRLASLLGKRLPDGPCGESWEVVDLPGEQSRVVDGEHAGRALAELVRDERRALLGEADLLEGRFPLLFKFIDAARVLSVQVHPDAHACARLGGGARPKTEAWYVLHAEPGARLYLGLRPGVEPEALRRALQTGELEPLLQPVEVAAGDFFFIPAGLLHAIGAGIVLAEIQQSSDTTYRVFDWNRAGLDGKPRPLHTAEALESIRFELHGRIESPALDSGRPGVRSDFFSFERLDIAPGHGEAIEPGRPVILACIAGAGRLEAGAGAIELERGASCLLPACLAGELRSRAGGRFLAARA